MKRNAFILIVLVSIFSLVSAQSPVHTTDTTRISSTVRVGLQFKNDYYYMGRADSAKAPYLTPSITYFHKSGLFISGYLSYLTAPEQNRIDLITLAAGYDYYTEKIATGISVNQYFFSDLSYSVQAEMSTYLSAYFGYDFKVFMLVADASMGVSSNLDFFLGGELSRSFYFFNDKLRITPSLYTNFGTQHYYNEYYSQRSLNTGEGKGGSGGGSGGGGGGGGGGSGGGGSGGSGAGGSGSGGSGSGGRISAVQADSVVTEISTLESEKFQILDYELGLQISYRIKKFRFIASSTVLFPLNPSTVITNQSTYQEDLKTGFLWSVGVRYTIK